MTQYIRFKPPGSAQKPAHFSAGSEVWRGGYRYGFNGKENDNEVKGKGNQQDCGMRYYDTRIGRFLSVDPIAQRFPYYTPYQFAGNKPIVAIDLDGLEDVWIHLVINSEEYCESEFKYFNLRKLTI